VWGDLGRDSTEVLIVLDSVPKAAFDVVPIINNFGTLHLKLPILLMEVLQNLSGCF
jgi:hypothetical protein